MSYWVEIFFFIHLGSAFVFSYASFEEEQFAAEYLRNLNQELIERFNVRNEAKWEYMNDISVENEKGNRLASGRMGRYMEKVAQKLRMFNWRSYKSEDLRRQFSFLTNSGYSVLSSKEYGEFMDILSTMKSHYNNVRVCDYKLPRKCDLPWKSMVGKIFSKSRNPDELKHYWNEFYSKAGRPMRQRFQRYVELHKKAAKLNYYSSGAQWWLSRYGDVDIEHSVMSIIRALYPLYEQIHGYVRHRLRMFYGDIVPARASIPMHLLGNLWGQHWSNIADLVLPFPNHSVIDVTTEMIKQGYTPKKMFKMGEEFFTSMGLMKLPTSFWVKSLLEKPTDGRSVACQASAWDFHVNKDVRIKMCTRVTQNDFYTVHHELTHIQHFLQYQELPFVFHGGANPGFRDALADLIKLSVSTPKHLERIGLLKNYVHDDKAVINQLFIAALDTIVFLPFAFTIDKYRWSLFRGIIEKEDWNCGFWKLREDFSGIEPPIERSDEDFDPPAKFHISANVEYLKYVVSVILKFQLYKSACIKAGEYVRGNPKLPLNNCDFYGSKEVGRALHNLMLLGSSKPWPDVLKGFSGENNLSGAAIMEYFEPLLIWLEAENKRRNVYVGWTDSNKCRLSLKSSAHNVQESIQWLLIFLSIHSL